MRQELSTALYQHDAATRVIARLLVERDEARDALSHVTVGAGTSSAANGEQMEVDAPQVPEYIQEKVAATKAECVVKGLNIIGRAVLTDSLGFLRIERTVRYRRTGR